MKVNEIFYSIQGEGCFTGTPAVFVRFAHCNLRCSFCDTEFDIFKEMTEDEIIAEIHPYPARHVVLTGGEPTLQLTVSFLQKLHEDNRFVQIETNGTRELPYNILHEINWVTCSPKFEYNKNADVKLQMMDELKVVYQGQDMAIYDDLCKKARHCYIQPCDTGDVRQNENILFRSVDFIKKNTQWKLSLQTQKILRVR